MAVAVVAIFVVVVVFVVAVVVEQGLMENQKEIKTIARSNAIDKISRKKSGAGRGWGLGPDGDRLR